MTEKLLHERLRERAENNEIFYGRSMGMDGVVLTTTDCAKLADEIQRTYIPIPRFEDGEPADSKLFDKEEAFLTVYADGSWKLEVYGEVEQQGDVNTPVKRPVFDAEGERIRKGDTVWPTDTPDMKMLVDNFQCIYGQAVTVNCEFEGEIYNFNSDKLTHHEPDSLGKLRDDIERMSKSLGCHTSSEMKKLSDRLTALIERGA